MVTWLHPIAALATLALAGYAASLGLHARRGVLGAERARRRHRAIGPWLYALVLLNWTGGLGTVWLFRSDLELDPAASGHFTVGTAIALVLTAAAWLSRHVPTDARARAIHPILGATALVLSGVQIFLGLQLLR